MTRFSQVTTKHYAWFTVVLCLLGAAFDKASGLLWVHFGIHGAQLEYLGLGLFWSGYAILWLLVPIAFFRPDARFYCGGDRALRFKRSRYVLLLVVLIHVWLIISYLALYASLGRVSA
jgi:hypothetical protein